MKDLLQQFIDIEVELSAARGDFSLFALFLRDDSPDRWDLVAAAPWMNFEASPQNSLNDFSLILRERLSIEQTMQISRLSLFNMTKPEYSLAFQPLLNMVRNATGEESFAHGIVEFFNVNLLGQSIRHAYIITAQSVDSLVLVS